MPRKAPMVASAKSGLPKLWVRGSSVLTGRRSTLLRIRPTLVQRLEAQSYGPLYLLLEHAVERLCEELEAAPEGSVKTLDAEAMNPSREDIELVEATERKRERAAKAAADAKPARKRAAAK
jgi:hypothetical protein